jgi:Uma2 family endonuclease
MAQSITLPPLIRGEWLAMSTEEFDAWVSDGKRAEWVDGRGIVFGTTSARHVRASVFFTTLLRLFLGLTGVGEVFDAPFEMRLRGGRSRREPDIMVVLTEHRDRIERHLLDGRSRAEATRVRSSRGHGIPSNRHTRRGGEVHLPPTKYGWAIRRRAARR